jgi:hypothetical protein
VDAQVPTVLSLVGALLVICASFLLGVLERGPEPRAKPDALKPLTAASSPLSLHNHQPLLQRSWSQASSSSETSPTSQSYGIPDVLSVDSHIPSPDMPSVPR